MRAMSLNIHDIARKGAFDVQIQYLRKPFTCSLFLRISSLFLLLS